MARIMNAVAEQSLKRRLASQRPFDRVQIMSRVAAVGDGGYTRVERALYLRIAKALDILESIDYDEGSKLDRAIRELEGEDDPY